MADLGTFLTGDPTDAPQAGRPVVYDPAKGAYVSGAVGADATAFLNAGKNLANPAEFVEGYYVNDGSGNLVALANHRASGWIPVKAGQPYTITAARKYALYTPAKTYIPGTGTNVEPAANRTFTPAQDGYLRFSVNTIRADQTQVEEGTTATPREEFGYTFPLLQVTTGTTGPLTATRTGNGFTVDQYIDGTSDLLSLEHTVTDAGRNGLFNPASIVVAGTRIVWVTDGDDIAPITTQSGMVGANHGYSVVRAFANPDGKTTADIGSVWTDGYREFVLLNINSDGELVMGGSYTVDGNGVVNVSAAAPASGINLTHVSGATRTGTILRSTIATEQLHPSTARRRVTFWIDGEQVTGDFSRKATQVQVRESYEILDYADLYDKAKANIGTPYTALDVRGGLLVENRYTYRPGGVLLVDTDLTELVPTVLAEYGFVQALRPSWSGTTTVRNIPGTTPVGGFDFDAGVDMATASTSIVHTSSDLKVPGRPPVLSVDRIVQSGSTRVGFVMGYVPFGGHDTDSAARIASAPSRLWAQSSVDKNYPNAIGAKPAGWGHVTGRAYRAYLPPSVSDEVALAGDPLVAWSALNAHAQIV